MEFDATGTTAAGQHTHAHAHASTHTHTHATLTSTASDEMLCVRLPWAISAAFPRALSDSDLAKRASVWDLFEGDAATRQRWCLSFPLFFELVSDRKHEPRSLEYDSVGSTGWL